MGLLAGDASGGRSNWARLGGLLGNQYVVLLAQLAMGALMVYAGWEKSKDTVTFAWTIEDYQLVSRTWARFLAVTLPYTEMAVGLALLVGLWPRLAGLGLTLLVTMFIGAMSLALLKGITNVDCGCFGPSGQTPLSWAEVARDVPMLLASALVMIWGDRTPLTVHRLVPRPRRS